MSSSAQITDSIYDALEELILDDITYIDSSAFSESTTGTIVDSMFKYIDHLLMYRRPDTQDFVILPLGTVPQLFVYTPPDAPRGASG